MKRAWAFILALVLTIQMYGVIHQYDLQPTEISSILASNDSLLIAEHTSEGGIHIYDCSDPYNLVHLSTIDGSYTVLRLKGDHLYCLYSHTITVFDLQDQENPEILTAVEVSDYIQGYNGQLWDVEEYDGRLYVHWRNDICDYQYMIMSYEIWDISAPSTPVLIESAYSLEPYYDDVICRLRFLGNCAYELVNEYQKLRIYDISDFNNWELITEFTFDNFLFYQEFTDDKLYQYRSDEIYIIDISEAESHNFSETGRIELDFGGQVTIQDGLLTLRISSEGLCFIDVDDFGQMEVIGYYEGTDIGSHYVLPVDDNRIAYPAGGYMHYIDASEPENTRCLGSFDRFCNDFLVQDEIVYATGFDIDFSDPGNPVYASANSYGDVILLHGNYSVVCSDNRIMTFDITDPMDTPTMGWLSFDTYHQIIEADIIGDYLYAVTNYGLLTVNLTDIENPTVEDYTIFTYITEHVFALNGRLYAWDNWNGLYVYSVDNVVPVLEYHYEPGYVEDVVRVGDFIYIFTDDRAWIYSNDGYGDLTYENDFQFSSSINRDHVSIHNDQLVIADNFSNGLLIYDVSNPTQPVYDTFYCWNYHSLDIQYEDDRMYILTGSNGLQVLDIGTIGNSPQDIVQPEFFATNYPNPFNPSTTISFSLPEAGNTELTIYNIRGQKVKTLVKERLDAGDHDVNWDGTDDRGEAVSSGVYLYRIRCGNIDRSSKMLLIK